MLKSINLLPWRATIAVKQQQLSICRLVSSLLLSTVIIISTYLASIGVNQQLQHHIQRLQQQSQQYRPQIKQFNDLQQQWQQVQMQFKLLQALAQQRYQTIHYLSAIANILPTDINLTELQQHEQQLLLRGKAATNHGLAHFLQQLRQATALHYPSLLKLDSEFINGQEEVNFSIKLDLTGGTNANR